MTFVEELRKRDHSVSTMGIRARERARKAGVSSFYLDPDSDDVIVEEKSDGTLVRNPLFDDSAQQHTNRPKVGISD